MVDEVLSVGLCMDDGIHYFFNTDNPDPLRIFCLGTRPTKIRITRNIVPPIFKISFGLDLSCGEEYF